MPTFDDASTHNNTGAILSVVSPTSGPLSEGTALSFAALGWLSRTGAMPALPLNGPYTMEFWIHLAPGVVGWMGPLGWSITDEYAFVTTDFDADGTFGQDLEVYQGFPGQYAALDDSVGPGFGPAQDSRWHHVVLTNTGGVGASAYVFYLDTVPLPAIAVGGGDVGTQGDVTSYVAIGDGPFIEGWGEPVHGGLGHVAVYPVVLTPAQVLAHYQAAGYRNLDPAALPLVGIQGFGWVQKISSTLHTLSSSLTPSGALSSLKAAWTYLRGILRAPQSPIRSLTIQRGGSLRALATNASDLVLAPEDANVAFTIDWSNVLPTGIGVASLSVTALQKTATQTFDTATDVTSSFIISAIEQVATTRIVVGNGAQVLGATYRIRTAAHFSNTPATILECYFDLVCSES